MMRASSGGFWNWLCNSATELGGGCATRSVAQQRTTKRKKDPKCIRLIPVLLAGMLRGEEATCQRLFLFRMAKHCCAPEYSKSSCCNQLAGIWSVTVVLG